MSALHRGEGGTRVRDISTLLGVWAHPDDEAYLSSGLMALVSSRGGRVVVATATRGEHGTPDPGAWPPERLAPVRERELAASLAAVGVTEHRWFDHLDGGLPDVPFARGVADVAAVVDEVRPDVIVTFGPDGMTGHADHRTVSAWVEEAWRLTGRTAELWFATFTPRFHAQWGALNDEVGLWMVDPPQPPETDHADLSAHLALSGELLDRKHRALRAHASQTRALEDLVGSHVYRQWWSTESFVAAAPTDEAEEQVA